MTQQTETHVETDFRGRFSLGEHLRGDITDGWGWRWALTGTRATPTKIHVTATLATEGDLAPPFDWPLIGFHRAMTAPGVEQVLVGTLDFTTDGVVGILADRTGWRVTLVGTPPVGDVVGMVGSVVERRL